MPAYANFRFILNIYYNARKPEIINLIVIIKSDNLKNLYNKLRIELEFIRKQI